MQVPLAHIQDSKTNPCPQFDEAKLAELADFVPGNKTCVMFRTGLCGLRNYRWSIIAIDLTNQILESVRLTTTRSEPRRVKNGT